MARPDYPAYEAPDYDGLAYYEEAVRRESAARLKAGRSPVLDSDDHRILRDLAFGKWYFRLKNNYGQAAVNEVLNRKIQ